MFWGGWNPTAIAAAAAGSSLPVPTQESLENQAKKQAERAIEEAGIGICQHCDEEIQKNDHGIWESEFLLGYCSASKDGKHRPVVKYVFSEGVINAKRNSETHAEPVSEAGAGSGI